MARKTSDMALLLGHRGKSRSRKSGGFGQVVAGLIDKALGRKSSRSRRNSNMSDRSAQAVSVWVLLIAVLASFGGGFLLGGKVNAAGDGVDPLRADGRANGRKPAFVGEVDTTPLSTQAFIVSAYPNMSDAAAKAQADKLTRYLNSQGLAKARPYHYPVKQGLLWVVSVYFAGELEKQRTMDVLRALPENVPDQNFCEARKHSDWLKTWTIR